MLTSSMLLHSSLSFVLSSVLPSVRPSVLRAVLPSVVRSLVSSLLRSFLRPLLLTLLLHPCLFTTDILEHPASATQEYDLIVKEWKKGKPLQLKHSLFQIDKISEGMPNQIVFTGKTSGAEGEILLSFFTLEGDSVYVPRSSVHNCNVDQQRRNFTVSAMIPTHLRGKEGAVQVTFTGEKRAAFYMKVYF